jgi:hypothetical protein
LLVRCSRWLSIHQFPWFDASREPPIYSRFPRHTHVPPFSRAISFGIMREKRKSHFPFPSDFWPGWQISVSPERAPIKNDPEASRARFLEILPNPVVDSPLTRGILVSLFQRATERRRGGPPNNQPPERYRWVGREDEEKSKETQALDGRFHFRYVQTLQRVADPYGVNICWVFRWFAACTSGRQKALRAKPIQGRLSKRTGEQSH